VHAVTVRVRRSRRPGRRALTTQGQVTFTQAASGGPGARALGPAGGGATSQCGTPARWRPAARPGGRGAAPAPARAQSQVTVTVGRSGRRAPAQPPEARTTVQPEITSVPVASQWHCHGDRRPLCLSPSHIVCCLSDSDLGHGARPGPAGGLAQRSRILGHCSSVRHRSSVAIALTVLLFVRSLRLSHCHRSLTRT
jgi:hypothetical protein